MAKKTVEMPSMLDDSPAPSAQENKSKWPAVTCHISPEDRVRLKVHCATTGTKQKDALERAITEYLDRHPN